MFFDLECDCNAATIDIEMGIYFDANMQIVWQILLFVCGTIGIWLISGRWRSFQQKKSNSWQNDVCFFVINKHIYPTLNAWINQKWMIQQKIVRHSIQKQWLIDWLIGTEYAWCVVIFDKHCTWSFVASIID